MGSLLGYLVVKPVRELVYMGGLGVFNEFGIPQEFRYTDPVEPTEVQRILFGDSLDLAVRVKVVGESLIKELSVSPEYIIVGAKDMLQIRSSVPIAYLEHTQHAPLEDVGKYVAEGEGYLVQLYPAQSPYYLLLAGKKKDVSKLVDILVEFAMHIADVIEPLKRVEGVIDYIYNTQYKL
ncbi:hypothetical protein GM182_05705 [bacterium 3DAC]|jgi:hypothetical protein|nr:hypothetical protein [Dictyoglomota bacterium]UZN23360.1 hypothetical protein GM182_05705 [bacterium 3DAC]